MERNDRREAVTIAALRVTRVGGEEVAVAELADGLRARGHKVVVIAAECDLSDDGLLRVIRIPVPVRPAALSGLLLMSLGSLVVWRRQEGLLHTIGPQFLNRRAITTAHFCSVAFSRQKRSPRRSRDTLAYRVNEWLSEHIACLAERWSYRPGRTSQLVSVSPGGAAELAECFGSMKGRVEVIPNAVDRRFRFDHDARERVRAELGIPSEELVALFVGGDWGRKRLASAIGAVGMTLGWRLMVVGSGDQAAYEEGVARAGAAGRVHFCGQVSDTAPYYSAADAFVLPSTYETFGLVMYEAAATGLPLLGTRVSGVEELIVEGQNGWFIDADPWSTAARLEELAEDRELRDKMGRKARAAARDFTWDRVVERYEQLYTKLSGAVTPVGFSR